MKRFYDVDADEIITIDTVRNEYERAKAEEGYTDTFGHYLECCMTRNNGSLQTLEQYYNSLTADARRMRFTDPEDNDGEAKALEQYAQYIKGLIEEG